MAVEDIGWALAELGHKRHKAAKEARDYYEGTHALAFMISRFETVFATQFLANLKDNLCSAVIDSLTDRLELTGLSSSAAERKEVTDESGAKRLQISDSLASEAWSLWWRNDMDQRSTEVHREAFLSGDAYVVVWPDPNGKAAIWVRDASEMAVAYSEETPGAIDVAARRWQDRLGRWHIDLFYPDHVERYATEPKESLRSPAARYLARTARLMGIKGTGSEGYKRIDEDVPNLLGRVPVFHFANKRLYDNGIGELVDVLPLQDGLNKSICDLFVNMEFAAFPQRWATGLEVEVDEATGKPKAPPFAPGPDRIFANPNEAGSFGQFPAVDLRQFLEVQESLRAEIARVSGIPLHYLYIAKGDFPSGEAMKSAEARFSKKIRDRQTSFGNVWQQVLTFALKVEEVELPDDFELRTLWVSPTPRSDEEHARTLTLKQSMGVPQRQLWKELGYSEDDIELMLAEAAADDAGDDQVLAQLAQFETTVAGLVTEIEGLQGDDQVLAQVAQLATAVEALGARDPSSELKSRFAALEAQSEAVLEAVEAKLASLRTMRRLIKDPETGEITGSVEEPIGGEDG